MGKFKKKAHRLPEKQNTGPANDNRNPRRKKGNPTKSGEIFGKWHKPKLG